MAVKISELTAGGYVGRLVAILKKKRNDKAARTMSAYMKDLFPFYGSTSPERKIILSEFLGAEGLPSDWKEFVRLCWDEEEREMQYLGMEIAYRCRKQFTVKDISVFKSLIIEKSWWDTVDFIASNMLGHYFTQFPGEIAKTTSAWSSSGNMWLIRTCLIFQLKYKEKTDFNLMKKLILEHKSSPEFFIRKAIGWALRQYAREDGKAVKQFVLKSELSPLSRKEALKHLA